MLRSLGSRGMCTLAYKHLDRSNVRILQTGLSSGGLLCTTNGPSFSSAILKLQPQSFLPAITHDFQPSRGYAARKGTRARKAAKKVKKVEVKREFVFKRLRKLAEMPYQKQRPYDDSHLPEPEDDVYFTNKFRSRKHPFSEAIQNFRESHHPTVYNVPNAPIHLRVNLDLVYPNRATKNMDGWKCVVEMKKPFQLEGMTLPSVLAFCVEDVDYIDSVTKEGGADLAGGKELIKAIQTGELNPDTFEYIVAHPSIVPDLTVIRGLIKRKFPSVRAKTISTDLVAETRRLKSGVKLQVVINEREPDFGYIETPIGTLDMEGLEENFKSVLMDTISRRVANKAPQDFVISCVLSTPGHGVETFKVDLNPIFEQFEASRHKKADAASAEE